MRETLKSKVSWSTLGWLMPLAFLVLPTCGFEASTSCEDENANLQAGCTPRTGALFCDIKQVLSGTPHCASDAEIRKGIRLSQAAVALTKNEKSTIVLDYSPAAMQAQGCTGGRPVAIVYQCPFPDGCPVCVNCGNYDHADVNAACAAKCEDLFDLTLQPDGKLRPGIPPDPLVVAFCAQNALASTNAGASCFGPDACLAGGTPNTDFADPRRVPEEVQWRDLLGVSATGNTLTRTDPPTQAFDRGAASVQSITTGDGYVEFTVTETNLARAFGLSSGTADDANPDLDRTIAGIGFAVRLTALGEVFVHQSGNPVGDPVVPLALYNAGDRIRVTVTDNLDVPHTASIAYHLIPASCAGPSCEGMPLLPPPYTSAPYPFRADASIRNLGGTLTDVRIVRIK